MIKVGILSEEQLDEKAKGGDGKKKKEEEKTHSAVDTKRVQQSIKSIRYEI